MRVDELWTLVADQAGMVARRQLSEYGVDWSRVRNEIAARRWVERTPRVISTFTGELMLRQREWLAVLHAGPRSMLANLSAARFQGLQGWDRPWVSVLVDDELSFEPVEGVDFFRSRRPFDLLRSSRPGIPVCQLEPAVLLWAGYEATTKAAHGVAAAVVQQRLTTATRMIGWIDQLRPLRRAKALKRTLSFVDGGAHSGAELELGRCADGSGSVLPIDSAAGSIEPAGSAGPMPNGTCPTARSWCWRSTVRSTPTCSKPPTTPSAAAGSRPRPGWSSATRRTSSPTSRTRSLSTWSPWD